MTITRTITTSSYQYYFYDYYSGFGAQGLGSWFVLGGSGNLVSKVISTLVGVITIVTLIITLVTKSHDPLSRRGCKNLALLLAPPLKCFH